MPDTIDDAQEHPIIFNDWSTTRILAGEKTQTRRIIRPQPPEPQEEGHYFDAYNGGPQWNWWDQQNRVRNDSYYDVDGISWSCPFGTPGDVLWVREAFRLPVSYENVSPSEYVDSDLPLTVRFEADGGQPVENDFEGDSWGRKRPSIHMPRELCRLRLRVEDVRVERVQEISTEDARAEGVTGRVPEWYGDQRRPRREEKPSEVGYPDPTASFAKDNFQRKWRQIHSEDAWERNDWVWVVSFSRIENA